MAKFTLIEISTPRCVPKIAVTLTQDKNQFRPKDTLARGPVTHSTLCLVKNSISTYQTCPSAYHITTSATNLKITPNVILNVSAIRVSGLWLDVNVYLLIGWANLSAEPLEIV